MRADTSRLRRVVLMSRALGLAPYRCRESVSTPGVFLFEPSPRWRRFSSCVVIVCLALAVVYSVLHFTMAEGEQTFARRIGLFNACVGSLGLCSCVWMRQHRLLVRVVNSPVVQGTSSIAPLAPSLCIGLLLAGGFFLSSSMDAIFTHNFTNEHSIKALPRLWMVHSVRIILTSWDVSLFVFYLCCLQTQFEDLNDQLRGQYIHGAPLVARSICAIRRRHKEAAGVLQTLTRCFGLQTVLFLLMEFWWSLTHVFFALSSPNPISEPGILIDPVFSIMWQIGFVMVANRVSTQGNLALTIIHRLNEPSRLPAEDVKELNVFTDQLIQRPISVTLGAILEINTKLIFQGGATAITYIVILLQFHQQQLVPQKAEFWQCCESCKENFTAIEPV